MIRSQRSPYGTSLLGAGAVHHIKSGKARSEHIPSGLHPRAEIVDAPWHFRFVPILLQKSKITGANFPAVKKSDRRPPIDVASITLPGSPASFSSDDEVPHIFTWKSPVQPKEILIASAKRLLQQNRHIRDIARQHIGVRYRGKSGHAPDITAMTGFDPACVKTHTSAKCRKYNSPTRYRTSCAQHDSTP